MMEEETIPTRCPGCETYLDAAMGVGHTEAIQPGDISICYQCGEILEWLGDGYRRAVDGAWKEQLQTAGDYERLMELQKGIKELFRRRQDD